MVTLSIETNYRGVFDAAEKRIEYIEFLKKEYMGYFSKAIVRIGDAEQSRELIRIINQFDYLFQIHDSIKDLFHTKKVISEHYIELKSDILLLIRELSSQTLSLFDDLDKGLYKGEPFNIHTLSGEIQSHLDDANKELLSLLSDPVRRDAGALTNFITYSQRLKDKLINYAKSKTGS